MGRGRQKAKDTKVARQLKYSAPGSDLKALERELVATGGSSSEEADDADDVYTDRWDTDED